MTAVVSVLESRGVWGACKADKNHPFPHHKRYLQPNRTNGKLREVTQKGKEAETKQQEGKEGGTELSCLQVTSYNLHKLTPLCLDNLTWSDFPPESWFGPSQRTALVSLLGRALLRGCTLSNVQFSASGKHCEPFKAHFKSRSREPSGKTPY